MVVAVAALVTGATIAFYNDTETSTGNLFTAGSIDLTVDHTLASYNGEDCQTCHLEIVSDDTTEVGGNPAVELSFVHPAWTADLDGEHVAGSNDGSSDGSFWIWVSDGPTFPETNQDFTFDRQFEWTGTASDATLYIATDKLYTSIVLNGNFIGSTADENNFQLATEDVFAGVEGFLVQGTNLLQVTVRNVGLGGSNPQSNPAGLLFKLEIDGFCENKLYVYQNTPIASTCILWGEKDIDDEFFFNFDDIKPGDHGRNIISLHVEDNDAYACLIPHDIIDLDNSVVDPELALSDDNSAGELDDELEFFLWVDNGDGAYQNTEAILAGPGVHIRDIQTEMTAMQLTGGGPTLFLGLAWCAGEQTLDGNNIECDGSGMGDIAQTDSLNASISLYVEQIRNNPNFVCSGVDLETT